MSDSVISIILVVLIGGSAFLLGSLKKKLRHLKANRNFV